MEICLATKNTLAIKNYNTLLPLLLYLIFRENGLNTLGRGGGAGIDYLGFDTGKVL